MTAWSWRSLTLFNRSTSISFARCFDGQARGCAQELEQVVAQARGINTHAHGRRSPATGSRVLQPKRLHQQGLLRACAPHDRKAGSIVALRLDTLSLR
jgi:hypothetical protein